MTETTQVAEGQRKKVAISYSWTTPDHEAWVLRLAEKLVDNNVEVVLDKWEFDFGDDTIVYMERYVNDKTIDRVLLICDSEYARKADARIGGVGIETQIISFEVYERVGDRRFIPVVAEVDEEGRPYLPTYLRSKWRVDLSSELRYEASFQALMHSIDGKPIYKKPAFGKRPSYLDEDDDTQLVTVHKARTALEAIRNEKRTTSGMIEDYLDTFKEFLNNGQLKPLELHVSQYDVADIVLERIKLFLPYKSEFLEVMSNISRYGAGKDLNVLDALHRFFSDLVVYMHVQESLRPQYDLGRLVVYELFISCVAVFLRGGRLEETAYLLEQEYLDLDLAYLQITGPDYLGSSNFNAFDAYLRSFELASSAGGITSAYSIGNFLLDRVKPDSALLTPSDLVDADAVLYARGLSTAAPRFQWSLRTINLRYSVTTPAVFRKAASRSYFERLKRVINTPSAQDFRNLLNDLAQNDQMLRSGLREYQLHEALFNLQELGSR